MIRRQFLKSVGAAAVCGSPLALATVGEQPSPEPVGKNRIFLDGVHVITVPTDVIYTRFFGDTPWIIDRPLPLNDLGGWDIWFRRQEALSVVP